MIAPDSILRRLPPELDRKQTLFLDGIRHSAEIAHLAYERLGCILTRIAIEDPSKDEGRQLYTSALLDAWSVVDSIDRFRGLYQRFPESRMREGDASAQADRDTLQKVRNVRNVTDHLYTRMDHVLAKRSAAMGILSWCTVISPEQGTCIACAIIPGTLGRQSGPIVNPAGKQIEIPSGLISIKAGEHTADLSAAMTVLRNRVAEIEKQVDDFVDSHNLRGIQAGSDFCIRLSISLDTGAEARPATNAIGEGPTDEIAQRKETR